MSITVIALLATTLVTLTRVTPAKAAGGTGTWGSWTVSSKTAGSLNLNVAGFTSPSATFTTNATGLSLASGANTWLNEGTLPGAEYGTSRNNGYLSMGTATSGADSTTTFTFLGNTPTSGWSFALGDIDADAVTITALDGLGNPVNVAGWTVTPFNYCNNTTPRPTSCAAVSTDMPTWNAGTATVTGTGNDTDGASAWVQPNSSLSSLSLTFKKQVGFPNYQLWFAGDTPADKNYKLTVAARTCPTYSDIMANKARNNIMQSLQDLGVNSLYSQSTYAGPVRPAVESLTASGQDVCTPLAGWKFSLSNGTNGTDTGSFGALSKLKTPIQASVTTQSTIPELDELGNNSGRTLPGAITYNLTPAQISSLANKTLWVQGGTPGDPLNGRTDLAYGTLRCAIDNANGDNVEWVGVAAGTRHAFCYAYYVSATETSGKIIIQKTVPAGGAGVNFGFGGNLSFNNGGKFSLASGASQTFIRAAGQQWDVSEDLPVAPFELASINCLSQNGFSATGTNLGTRSASINLAAGDTVTCTFTNEFRPKATIELYKVSNGNVGTFGFKVTNSSSTELYSGNTVVASQDTPTLVSKTDGLPPGDYTVQETSLPAEVGGTWGAPTISCIDEDGNAVPTVGAPDAGSVVTLNGKNVGCIVTNTFTPNAQIHVLSKIIGSTGAISADSSYVISPADYETSDDITLVNTAWDDAGKQSGDLTNQKFGDYNITAAPPTNTDTETWELDSLDCSGGASYIVTGSNVDLTLDDSSNTAPEITCTYVWKLTKLANVYLEKISLGDVGTFTLTAAFENSENSADVTTTSTGVATRALSLLGVPEGTPIIIGETNLPSSTTGNWNLRNSGDPDWNCQDSVGNLISVNGANEITATDKDITCTATNTFTEDPTPSPSPTDSSIAYTADGSLPNAGDAGSRSATRENLWQRMFSMFR